MKNHVAAVLASALALAAPALAQDDTEVELQLPQKTERQEIT